MKNELQIKNGYSDRLEVVYVVHRETRQYAQRLTQQILGERWDESLCVKPGGVVTQVAKVLELDKRREHHNLNHPDDPRPLERERREIRPSMLCPQDRSADKLRINEYRCLASITLARIFLGREISEWMMSDKPREFDSLVAHIDMVLLGSKRKSDEVVHKSRKLQGIADGIRSRYHLNGKSESVSGEGRQTRNGTGPKNPGYSHG